MKIKDTNFSELMRKPDQEFLDRILESVSALSKVFEEELGVSRFTFCEGLLKAAIELAARRYDERYFQKPNDIRRFYLLASQLTNKEFASFTSYKVQWNLENLYGKDYLPLRDTKLYGCTE